MISLNMTYILKAIPLGFKLLFALKIKKPSGFDDDLSLKLSLKMRLWNACLLHYIKELRTYISFSCTSEQQHEVLFHVTRIAILVEKEFDSASSVLNSKNIRSVILGNIIRDNTELFKISKQVCSSVSRIKDLVPNNLNYNNFINNIAQTWETHKIRDVVECNTSVSEEDVARCAEDRGGFYFLALAFALNPENLTDEYQRAIYFCGAWFQITDDYSDRKKDNGKKNTPFTAGASNTPEKIFQKYKTIYRSRIEETITGQNRNILIEFMEKLCTLLLLSPF